MALSITPKLIIKAAKKRGWRVAIIDEEYSFYRLELPDGRHYFVRNITTNKTGLANSIICERKDLFYKILAPINVPMPDTYVLENAEDDGMEFMRRHKSIVVKPTDQAHGNGITVDVRQGPELKAAIQLARTYSQRVVLQQQVGGDDYRLLFIDKKFVAAAIREPAFVIGDGKNSLKRLIEIENTNGRRAPGYQSGLTHIDAAYAEIYLKDLVSSIPAEGEKTRVMGTANIGRGGVSMDVTHTIDDQLIAIGRRVVDFLGLGICGVDIMYETGKTPYLIEVNTGPSLGLHEYPYEGEPRQTPEAFLDWLAT